MWSLVLNYIIKQQSSRVVDVAYRPSSAGPGSDDMQEVSRYSPPEEKTPRRHPDTNHLLLLLLLLMRRMKTEACSALTIT